MSGMDQIAQSQLQVAQAMSALADDMVGFAAGQLPGTTTNNDADTGNVGEYLDNSAGAKVLPSGTPVDLGQIELTAGDWDVGAVVDFNNSGDGTLNGSISTTSVTPLLSIPNYATFPANSSFSGSFTTIIGPVRKSISATTTYYLVGSVNLFAGACSATGFIHARRVR